MIDISKDICHVSTGGKKKQNKKQNKIPSTGNRLLPPSLYMATTYRKTPMFCLLFLFLFWVRESYSVSPRWHHSPDDPASVPPGLGGWNVSLHRRIRILYIKCLLGSWLLIRPNLSTKGQGSTGGWVSEGVPSGQRTQCDSQDNELHSKPGRLTNLHVANNELFHSTSMKPLHEPEMLTKS